ncbi:MAG: OmpA family protein [Bacteroidota bacterium]
MNPGRLFLSFLFACIFFTISAQKNILKQADRYFNSEKYLDALELYEKIPSKEQDENMIYRRGVCHYFTNNIDAAIQDFTNARGLGYEKKEIYYFAAKAFHAKKLFADASRFYKNYLRFTDKQEEQRRIIELIKQCKFGIDNQYNDQIAFVENLGKSVNTEYDEVNPIQSPTSQNKYYFSSNRSGSHGGLRNARGYKDEIYGKYSADMYAVELSGGNWTPVSAFHPILNGPKHDLIEGFNPDGSVLYFLKSQDWETGQIYADTFSVDKDPEAFPKRFSSPAIPELGDKCLQVFNNNTMLFSSKRKGGYGGYDLYVSLKKDGIWEAPVNLGPEINSKYDEVDPYLTKSGTKLFFSSDRIESFGDFDIYVSEYGIETLIWSKPINLGFPINSAKKDRNFSVSTDGMTAIFSSDRPDSQGGSDLYLAYFKDQVTEQLLYVEEAPFIRDGIEEVAENISENQDTISNTVIDTESIVKKEFLNGPLYYGGDEIILNPINSGKMKRVKDLMVIYPELHVTFSGHSTKEGMREFDLYFSIKRAEKAAEYLIDNGIDANRISVKGLGSNFPHTIEKDGQSNRLAEKNNRRIDISFNDVPVDRLSIIEERPTASDGFRDDTFDTYYNTMEALAYKIHVAKTKQMFKGDVIREYNSGIIEKEYTDDSYTYTLGVFDTYNDARNLKSELLRRGIIEAKVVPYIDNRAINLEQIKTLKDSYTDLNEYLKFETE